jgi:membrane-bound serine protease (ClpP class)
MRGTNPTHWLPRLRGLRWLPVLSVVFLVLGMGLPLVGPGLANAVAPLSDNGGAEDTIVVIPIEGTIDLGLVPFVQRAIEENPSAAAVILDVDTHGGRVDAAVQIRDTLLDTDIPVVAFVHRRAISAGALISLAADHIAFAPGGSMGAATPVQMGDGEMQPVGEKVVSYMRAEMRATAEATGRDGDLAEAMVDADIVIDGVVAKGKLLTVTTESARELGLTELVVEDLPALLDALGLGNARTIDMNENWAESFARFVTDPTVAGLLMSLGVLGIMVELYSPGFGVPGTLGVVSLVLFFFGHSTVSLVGWEEVILLTIGFLALLVEFLIIPGFGVIGIAGILLVMAGLALALVGAPLEVAWDLGTNPGGLMDAMSRVVIALAVTIVGMGVAVWALPKKVLPKWLVLDSRIEESAPGTIPAGQARTESHGASVELVGKVGSAVTDLRPSGKARIDGRIIDVVSLHEYIRSGAQIEVTEVEGMRVVVNRAPPSPANA